MLLPLFKTFHASTGNYQYSLPEPVDARFVRFHPTSYHNKPQLKVELYGCHYKWKRNLQTWFCNDLGLFLLFAINLFKTFLYLVWFYFYFCILSFVNHISIFTHLVARNTPTTQYMYVFCFIQHFRLVSLPQLN